MKVYYALYDQSYDNNAQYWTWFPEEITQKMRDAIASKAGAFQMRPKHPNQLAESDIVGGIINYQDQWCVVYRFFNGGNDPQGRPDRCVLATAWVRTEDAQRQNLFNLLFCPVFLDVQKKALCQCPVQVPAELEEDCNYPVSQFDPQLAIYSNNPDIGSWSYRSSDEVEVIGKLFPFLIADGLKSLQVLQSAAYMETFSGTPLASGITYVPNDVIQPDSAYNDDLQDQQQRRNINLVFLLAILFILSSLLAYDRLTKHGFLKLFFPNIVVIEEQESESQDPEGQYSEEQNPNEQNPNVEYPNVENPNVEYPNVENPGVENPRVENLNVENPRVENPRVENPRVENPRVENLRVENPRVENPRVENLNVENPNIQESGRPIYPSGQQRPQDNSLLKPHNDK